MGWGGHSPVSDGHDPGWDSELASLSEGTCPFGSSCWSAVSRLQANLMLKSSHDDVQLRGCEYYPSARDIVRTESPDLPRTICLFFMRWKRSLNSLRSIEPDPSVSNWLRRKGGKYDH